jgi:hypothetical protein
MKTKFHPELLPEVMEDEIIISPDNINLECQANMWVFGLTGEDAAAITSADVETFLLEVVAARRRQVATLAKGPMLFYCWHDELAAQLRFSMVMSCHGKLPFGGPPERVADLGEIIRPFLKSKFHDGIPWSALTDTTGLSDSERERLEQEHEKQRAAYKLKVWVQEIPSHGPLAAQPYTDIAELDPLAQSAKELKRLLLTSDDVVALAAVRSEVWLAVLEKYPSMGRCVAGNKAVPISIFEVLASHPDRLVRMDVAMKRRTPERVMLKLAGDSDESVRHELACNAKATRVVLEKLAKDASSWVRETARERLGLETPPANEAKE